MTRNWRYNYNSLDRIIETEREGEKKRERERERKRERERQRQCENGRDTLE